MSYCTYCTTACARMYIRPFVSDVRMLLQLEVLINKSRVSYLHLSFNVIRSVNRNEVVVSINGAVKWVFVPVSVAQDC